MSRLPRNAPIHSDDVNNSSWRRWFERLSDWFVRFGPAPDIEKDNLPDPKKYKGAWVYVSDETIMVFSDGSDWRRCDDGQPI